MTISVGGQGQGLGSSPGEVPGGRGPQLRSSLVVTGTILAPPWCPWEQSAQSGLEGRAVPGALALTHRPSVVTGWDCHPLDSLLQALL